VDEKNEQIAHRRIVAEWETKESWAKQQFASHRPRQYWESLTATQRIERGVPSRLLSVDDVSNATIHLATDRTLAGRVLLCWSEGHPRLIRRGDRGYKDADEIVFQSAS
jgi:hypothetical protein